MEDRIIAPITSHLYSNLRRTESVEWRIVTSVSRHLYLMTLPPKWMVIEHLEEKFKDE